MITIRLAGCAGLLAVVWHAPTTAQSADPQGWYVGLSGGTSQVDAHRGDSRESGADAHGQSLRGGLRLSRWFGVEAAIHEADDLMWTNSSSFPYARTSFDVRAVEVSGVWVAPICRLLESMVKGGLAYYDLNGLRTVEGGLRTNSSPVSVTDSGLGYTVSFGFAVKPTDRLRVRFAYQVFDIDEDFLSAVHADDATIDAVSIGLDYRLGRSER